MRDVRSARAWTSVQSRSTPRPPRRPPARRRSTLRASDRGLSRRPGPGVHDRRRRARTSAGGTWEDAARARRSRRGGRRHLDHLTPIHEAAERRFPDVPVHRRPARHRAADARGDRGGPGRAPGSTPPAGRARCGAGRRGASACRCSRPTPCAACPTPGVDPERLCGCRTGSTPPAFDRRPQEGEARWAAVVALAGRGAARMGLSRASRAAWPHRGAARAVSWRGPGDARRRALHRGRSASPLTDPRPRPRARVLRDLAPLPCCSVVSRRVGGREPLEVVRETADEDVSGRMARRTTTCPRAQRC